MSYRLQLFTTDGYFLKARTRCGKETNYYNIINPVGFYSPKRPLCVKRLKIFNEVVESLCVPLGSAPRLKSGQPGRVGRPVVWEKDRQRGWRKEGVVEEPQHLAGWTPSRKQPERKPQRKVITSLLHRGEHKVSKRRTNIITYTVMPTCNRCTTVPVRPHDSCKKRLQCNAAVLLKSIDKYYFLSFMPECVCAAADL